MNKHSKEYWSILKEIKSWVGWKKSVYNNNFAVSKHSTKIEDRRVCYDDSLCETPDVDCVECPVYKSL